MRRTVVVAALFVLAPASARAQSVSASAGDTVTVTQRALIAGDVTPAEAKRQALEHALAEAVRRVSGVRVQAAQLGVDEDRNGRTRDSFLSVVQLDAAGRATNYKILDERFVTERHPSLGSQLYIELRALVTVARESGTTDPGFSVAVSLNDALFFDNGSSLAGNDELIATITASQDAWLTIFDVTGDSAELLMPNTVMGETRLIGNRPSDLPSREWRDRGVHFRASLAAQETARRELLVVVATRSRISFPTDASPDGSSRPVSLMAIQRWLVTIPLEQRAIAFAAYEVRRRQ